MFLEVHTFLEETPHDIVLPKKRTCLIKMFREKYKVPEISSFSIGLNSSFLCNESIWDCCKFNLFWFKEHMVWIKTTSFTGGLFRNLFCYRINIHYSILIVRILYTIKIFFCLLQRRKNLRTVI